MVLYYTEFELLISDTSENYQKPVPFNRKNGLSHMVTRLLHLQSENKLKAFVQHRTGNTNDIAHEITISATQTQLS